MSALLCVCRVPCGGGGGCGAWDLDRRGAWGSAESGESRSVLVGPPPPFDPELLPAITAMAQAQAPALTLEMIPAIRQAPTMSPVPTVEDMRRGGAFDVTERLVPGPAGAPDVSLLICRPTGVSAPVPCLYYIHGGGMILATTAAAVRPGRSSTPRVSARPWSRSSTGWPRNAPPGTGRRLLRGPDLDGRPRPGARH